MTDPAGTGLYLFVVARDLPENALDGVTGLRDAPLQVVDHAGLQAVVCTVPLAEFGEDVLPQHLEDLAWLEEVARRHHEVVWAVAEVATVAPMRLVTICTDDDAVRRRLDAHHDGLVAALDSVQGRREWSVKAYADPAAAAQPAPEPAAPGGGAGAAYLQRKRAAAEQRRAAGDLSTATAEEIHRTLAGASVASRRLPPQDPRLTGRREPMILNGAYLVDEDAASGFRSTIEQLREHAAGALIEAEGPWPPYSFAVLEQA